MSYAKGTTHYNLPLTEGSDKRDWFDTNEPFNQIDAALHTAVEDTDTLKSEVATLQSDMTEAQTDIKDIKAYDALNDVKVSALQTLTAQHTVDIEDVRQDSEDMICAIEEGSATASYAHAVGEYFRYNDTLYITTVAINVGDTIVPDVNCSTTDIVTRLGNADEVSKLKTQVGDKDISSYGASVTDAIANSNVKVIDGDLYKLSDGAWSKMLTTERIDVSLDSNDYFTTSWLYCFKYGNIVMLNLSFVAKQALTANVEYTVTLTGIPRTMEYGTSGSRFSSRETLKHYNDNALITMILNDNKLYLTTDKDLSSGYQFYHDFIYMI